MQVKTRQAILHSEEFKALWDRIKHKTTYRVEFDNEALIQTCVKAIEDRPADHQDPAAMAESRPGHRQGGRRGDGDVGLGADHHRRARPRASRPAHRPPGQDPAHAPKPRAHPDSTSERLDDFKRNPQQFIDIAAEAINRAKRLAIVDGIKYQRIGDEEYYAQELFEQEELTGYLKNMLAAKKSVHEYVIYDSAGVERSFAEQMEKNEAVKVYAKLPGWFKVPTPLGTYNPDWAVVVESDGAERLYLVVETKSSLFAGDLRDRESAKIKCGEEHFKAIANVDNPAMFRKAAKLDDLLTA